ncbi:MAG: ribosomal protein S18-alanine N-acetyltransferase [Thermofilaceae archaeon]
MAEYAIRTFRPEDLDEVIKVNRENLPENYPPFFFKLHYENFPQAFIVAESSGKIVGYVMCRVETGKLYTKQDVGRQGHIVSIAVIPEMRGKGIGTKLMKRAMESLYQVYGVEEYYLEVRVSNMPAINLYTKLGFEKIKTLKSYYLNGEDAYLMAKQAP